MNLIGRLNRLGLGLVAASSIALGCMAETSNEPVAESEDEITGAPGTVGYLVRNPSGCSTQKIQGLAGQLVQEVQCIAPGALAMLPQIPNIQLGNGDRDNDGEEVDDNGEVIPVMQPSAVRALTKVANAARSTVIVNSAFRTFAQQFLLYHWRQRRACGLGLVAEIGKSNHESGLAIDIREYSAHRAALTAAGFRWKGSRDRVHFDFVDPDGLDLGALGILAFQRMWNRNNPNDRIVEDGEYGPQVRSRLAKTPANGFLLGPSCTPSFAPAE